MSFLVIEASFSFFEILIVTHTCRTFVLIFDSLSYPNHRLIHASFQNIKLDLVLSILYPNPVGKSFIEISS
jgi:hypothetical protein